MRILSQYMFIYAKEILGANATKVWITKNGDCILDNNNSRIPEKELREILEIISYNYFFIISEWKTYFRASDIKFYC